jgi:hypothetical protein
VKGVRSGVRRLHVHLATDEHVARPCGGGDQLLIEQSSEAAPTLERRDDDAVDVD